MSEYIHEVVLQEYLIENIKALELTVQHKKVSRLLLIDARTNKSGTFWDLEGKLENGVWIPIEVEWITHNFFAHKHNKDKHYARFINGNGILLVLRKNRETPALQQLSILDNVTKAKFRKSFKQWFKGKSDEFIDETLKNYMIGAYKRNMPRIIIYPLSKYARKNYFPHQSLYRKLEDDTGVIGFKEAKEMNS